MAAPTARECRHNQTRLPNISSAGHSKRLACRNEELAPLAGAIFHPLHAGSAPPDETGAGGNKPLRLGIRRTESNLSRIRRPIQASHTHRKQGREKHLGRICWTPGKPQARRRASGSPMATNPDIILSSNRQRMPAFNVVRQATTSHPISNASAILSNKPAIGFDHKLRLRDPTPTVRKVVAPYASGTRATQFCCVRRHHARQ